MGFAPLFETFDASILGVKSIAEQLHSALCVERFPDFLSICGLSRLVTKGSHKDICCNSHSC